MVLSRAPKGEANASIVLLTQDIGLVRARAQGVRRSGAKLAAALATFAERVLWYSYAGRKAGASRAQC